MDHQSATALFAAKGIDVTTNKDQGVIKVFTILSSCDCSNPIQSNFIYIALLKTTKLTKVLSNNKTEIAVKTIL